MLPETLATTRRAAGLGIAVPPRVVTNDQIAARLGVDPEWIVQRTGIRARHVSEPGDRLSDLAARAGSDALQDAGIDPGEVDLLLVATATADEVTPAAAPLVARDLGA